MKILHFVLALLSAIIVGFCIQKAVDTRGLWQVLWIASATMNAGYSFWHTSKIMEDE